MKKKTKKINSFPSFKNEDEEREFWATHSVTDYFDMSKFVRIKLPNLKPTTKAISLRLPLFLLDDLKILAHKRDVPYQSLLKTFLSERIKQELG